jgi:Trk K+ transport system NAD-binding subunit
MAPHVRAPARFLIYLRFTRYLLHEFRWPLGVMIVLVLGGGLILHLCYSQEQLSFVRACHAVFLLIFLESTIAFPSEWYLQPLFFVLPVVGLGAVADSVVRLAFLVFTRKQNLPEWNRMLASLCRNHFVVIGVGKVGYQVIRELLELRESVVAIEMACGAPLLSELFDKGVPVVQGNARMASVLEQGGVRQARAVIVTTSDDLTNLDAAITARELNREAKIVIRLFDETLATKVAGAFAMPTISTSQVAAPAFIAAATGRKIYQGFQLAGEYVHLTDITISPSGRLVGRTVGDIQSDKRLNIVMHQGASGVHVNPDSQILLQPIDTILVIAPMDALLTLESLNQAQEFPHPGHLEVPVASDTQAESAAGGPAQLPAAS